MLLWFALRHFRCWFKLRKWQTGVVLIHRVRVKSAISYYGLWSWDGSHLGVVLFRQKMFFDRTWRPRNLTPDPFPSGKGNRIWMGHRGVGACSRCSTANRSRAGCKVHPHFKQTNPVPMLLRCEADEAHLEAGGLSAGGAAREKTIGGASSAWADARDIRGDESRAFELIANYCA
jgi:hypothetical protein